MKQIILIRHTTPDIKSGICYGITDVDVKQSFLEEANEIKCYINKINPETVYSSPLTRCKKLSSFLYPNQNIVTDNRLKEMNFGEWELMDWSKIDKEEMKHWSSDFVNIPTPEGENLKNVYDRALSVINEIIDTQEDESTVTVITHSGVIRCLLAHYLQIPLENIFRLKLHFACIVKILIHENFEEVEIMKNNG